MKKRLFIAIELPEKFKSKVSDCILTTKLKGVKWVNVNQLHLTLNFLGDTEASLIPEIKNKLSNIQVYL